MPGTFEWPAARIPGIERMVLHWTAGESDIPDGGGHAARPKELRRYHILIEHDEGPTPDPLDDEIRVLAGVPIERNAGKVSAPAAHNDPDGYAAHVRGFNSGSVGLALCGMRGAVDYRRGDRTDVDPGPSPISIRQVEVMIATAVQFLVIWGFNPTPDRLFTHWEAGFLHNRPQGGRWDIGWIPGYSFRREQVGEWIRERVREAMG